MKKKVDLKKILGEPSFSSSGGYGEAIVLLAMKKACEEVLLLAAENARILTVKEEDFSIIGKGIITTLIPYYPEKIRDGDTTYHEIINRDSILNTINQVK